MGRPHFPHATGGTPPAAAPPFPGPCLGVQLPAAAASPLQKCPDPTTELFLPLPRGAVTVRARARLRAPILCAALHLESATAQPYRALPRWPPFRRRQPELLPLWRSHLSWWKGRRLAALRRGAEGN